MMTHMKNDCVQSDRYLCDCGHLAVVTQRTLYEFQWTCACGCHGVISWAHVNPPPQFQQFEVETVQKLLFD